MIAAVAVVAVVVVGVVTAAVVVAAVLEPCVEKVGVLKEFVKIDFAVVVDVEMVPSAFVRLAVKILWVVGWVMCDPAVAAASAERYAGEVVADEHFAWAVAAEEVPA